MLKNILKLRSSTVSALAVVVSLGATTAAFAESVPLVAMSRDGTVYLERSDDTYRVVSTSTGTSKEIIFPDSFWGRATGLSPDGKTVTGYYEDANYNNIGFVWTEQGGLVSVVMPSATSTQLFAVSDNGTAAGYYTVGSQHVAFAWKNGVVTAAPDLTVQSEAFNISRDGTTLVGTLERVDETWHALVWDVAQSDFRDIDTLGYTWSHASLVSKDGSAVAGDGSIGSSDKVFRWTADGMLQINDLMVGGDMYVSAMSDDGDVLVGSGEVSVGNTIENHAYRYIASSNNAVVGITYDLGTLGGNDSGALGISSDGKYIVGYSNIGKTGDDADTYRGFRWTESSGTMMSIEEWLTKAGVSVDYNTLNARYISDDGKVVVGSTDDYATYVARVGATSGIIKYETFYPTVAAANNITVQNSVSGANTIMFGAQGNPMRNLLSVGQRSVWGTVDSGHDDNDTSSGGLALGEFGLGYGIADGITARLSVGGTYTDQDLDIGGSVKQKGFYLSPEMSADLGGNVYLTVGGYWGRSSIDAKRGYMNGGTLDYSNGDTDADTWGGKIRFDWLNAVNISNTDITPYAALSYAHTTVDAYTETGGAFPVSYNDTKDHSTIARIGADFVHPLTDTVRVLAKTEASYQFEDQSSATSGTLIGIDNFNLAGQDLKQFWVRGGIGAEFDVGGGTASFMVNATTQGQDPDVWVRSNFTVKF
ncbi:autotransporter domain-containing protein [Agrobacterium rosae]